MGKLKVTRSIFFLLLVLPFTNQASFRDIHFKHITVENGLLSNRIRCILRDSRDYLWVGTDNGLNRYDGDKMESFNNSSEDSTSLSNNFINCIFEDSRENLWIGTNYGLNLYNRKTGSFQRYFHDPLKSNSLSSDLIVKILQDQTGTIWVTSMFGFNKYLPESNDFKQYYFPAEVHPTRTNNQRDNRNHSIQDFCYSDNTLWFGSMGDVLWSFKINEEQFERHQHPIIAATLNMEKRVVIHGNKVWIGSSGAGLIAYNIQSGEFKGIQVGANGKGTSGKDIRSLIIEKDSFLLIGIEHGGVNRLDLETMTMEYCIRDDKNDRSLNNNAAGCLYVDREGILYVGTTAGGLNVHNPLENQVTKYSHNGFNPNSLIYDAVFCIFEDSSGLIWLGTDGGGVSVFNPVSRDFKNFVHRPDDPTSIGANPVLCIGEDKNHDIWLGTWGGGLNKFDRQTEKFIRFNTNSNDPGAISGSNVWDMSFDDSGRIWLSYLLGNGVDIFDIQKGVIERFRFQADNSSGIMSNQVHAVTKIGKELGFSTNIGYCTWQPESKSFKKWDSLDNIYLNDVYLDSKGNYWFSSKDNGLLKIGADGITEQFGQSSELPKRITSVLEDKLGNIWIASYNGLCKYDVAQKEFTYNYLSYGDNNHQFAITSALKASDGMFYIGGFSGFYIFNPTLVAQNTFIPRITINEFQIFNKTVSIETPGSPLKHVIEETDEIVLDYKNAVFSFSFHALNYTYHQKAKYAYKLEGYDKEWVYTSSDRRFASYNRPNPGTYTFMVKASNNDGVWNEIPKTIKITIVPPYWQRWWFRISIAGLLLGTILSFFYWRINNLKQKQRVLEKAVWDRTTELRQANSELGRSKEEVMVKNIAIEKQNIELDIANQTKNKLFSIVAHDLKNPFNTILGFINILIDDYDDLSDSEKRNFLTLIQGSSQAAYNLIENLLDWARTQTNNITLHPRSINLKEMLAENVQLLQIFGESKSIQIMVEEVDALQTIFADKNMTDTVIRNLLTNAIKFSNKGATIKISSCQNGDYVEINLKDQGVGMTNAQIEKIFSIEENRSTQGTAGETGTGLGVIVCKEFVERNRGNIRVISTVGEGTTFVISLPSKDIENQLRV